MRIIKLILMLLLITSFAHAGNTVVIDGVSRDGVTVTITSGATPPIPTPIPVPVPTPVPTPIPPYAFCNDQYLSGTPRASVGVQGEICWFFDIPANKKGLLVQIIGRNDYSDAHMIWIFPDGRKFPQREDEGWILGPGTRSVNMQLRSQSTFTPNIPDVYVPPGRHVMKITGSMDGFMTVGF